MDEGLSYEDLQKAGASFEDAEPAPMSYEDLYKAGATFHDKPETSIGGAFARGAAEGAAPAVGGLGAGIVAGAAIGSAFAPGIGTGIGAAAGGLAAGMGAGYLISKGQDWVLDKLGLRDDPESMFGNEQRAADEEAHPYARFAGEMAPAAALLRPGGSMLQRGVGAAIGGAVTAGTDYLQTGEVDPVKALMGAGFGAALPGTNSLGDKFHVAGEGVGKRSPFAPKPPGTGFTMEGEPYGPDAPTRPMRDVSPGAAGPTRMLEGPQREFNPDVKPEPLDGEILNPDREQGYRGKYADQVDNATRQRDSFDPKQDPDLWRFWDDHITDLQSRADGKGGLDVDASLGPASEENPFTYRDSDRANDVTTTARGVAAENAPAPQIQGAGNPVGAPMEARSAQRPTGLLRDYRKTKPDAGAEVATQESTVVSQTPIHEDLAAALQGEQPPAARESVLSAPEPPPREPVAPTSRGRMVSPEEQRANWDAIATEPEPRGDARPPERAGQSIFRPGTEPRPEPPSREPHDFAPMESGEVLSPKANRVSRDPEFQDRLSRAEAMREARTVLDDDALAEYKQLDARHDKPVTAEVTPEQSRKLAHVEKDLQRIGEGYLEKWNALPMEERLKRVDALPAVSGSREAQTLPSGMTARSKADAARKQGVLDAYDKAVATYGTGKPDEPQGELLSRLKNLVTKADELAGGNKYRPNDKPASWQIVQAARKVLAKPTPKSIEAYRQSEATLKGEAAPDEGARLNQETARIEADIEKRPQLSDAAVEARLNQATPESASRPEHETFSNDKGEESAVYTREHNALTNWLNGLSDESHAKLMSEHPDLALDVKATQDPRELMANYMDDLSRLQTRQAEFEAAPAEDMPVAKRKSVKTAADLDRFAPVEPGQAASKGRVLNKNSPEFKAAAEAALNSKKGAKYDLDHEVAQQRVGAEDKQATEGTWEALQGKWNKLVEDQHGAISMPAWLNKKNWFSPEAPSPVKEAAAEFMKNFHILAGKFTNMDTKLRANWVSAPERPLVWRETLYQKLELKQKLNADEQKYYDDHVAPLKEWRDRIYNAWRKIDPSLPEPYDAGMAAHVPRMGVPDEPLGTHHNEPWKQGLGDWAGALEDRKWHVLEDGSGGRIVFRPSGTDGIDLLRPGKKPTFLKTPAGFAGNPGEKVTFNVNGKARDFTVDHATTSEIERSAHNEDYINFVKDPIITYSNAVRGMQIAFEKGQLLERLKSDERVLNNSTTDKAEARKKGYALEPTILKEMSERGGQELYLDKRLKWAFDDYAKSGVHDSELDPLRRFANTAAKPLYILSPAFHVLNVADNWAHAMATAPLKFREYPQLANESLRAIREVFTQGPLAQEFQAAGGRLMYPSQLLDGGVINQMLQKSGIELAKKPSIFDPITKATGLSIPDILHNAMVKSNKFMWAGNDMFALSLYQRNRRLGLSPEDAVKATHDWIGNYAADSPTFGGSRILQKINNDPAFSWFGRYHQDLWRTYGHMIKSLTPGTAATPQERKDAVGALVMSGLLMFGLYPYVLDKGAKMVTGNPEAEFGRRGMSAIQDAAYHLVKGDKTYTNLSANVWTPSIPVGAFTQGIANKDWSGKDIQPAEPLYKGLNALKAAGRLGDWAATQTIPGLSAAQGQFRQPNGSVMGAVKKFAESTVGIKDPSEGASRFEAHREQNQNKTTKYRERHPGGGLEWAINKLGN